MDTIKGLNKKLKMKMLKHIFLLGIVASVIYSEASPICSNYERLCIYSVIKNREHNKLFNNPSSLEAVVLQKKQFACITDGNKNMLDIAKGKQNTAVYNYCMELEAEKYKAVPDIVFYHDKSIKNAKGFSKYELEPVVYTSHFIFYRIKK